MQANRRSFFKGFAALVASVPLAGIPLPKQTAKASKAKTAPKKMTVRQWDEAFFKEYMSSVDIRSKANSMVLRKLGDG